MKKTTKTKAEIIKKLETLAKEPGFIYSFSITIIQDFFLDPAEAADINWRERLSFQEASFIYGLACKEKIDISVIPDEKTVKEHISKMKELFEQLHWAHNEPFMNKLKEVLEKKSSQGDSAKEMQNFFGNGEMMTEPIFYADSGAYDFQYWEITSKKYAKDAEWIEKECGISIQSIVEVSKQLKEVQRKKAEEIGKVKNFNDFCKSCLAVFSFGHQDLSFLDAKSFDAFIKLFSVIPGEINKNLDSVGSYNAVDSNPVIPLESGLYFMPLSFNLSRAVYESPFYWMGKDNNYKETCFKHRGEATEEIAYYFLSKVFGEKNVYKNVKILRKKGELITDIDILAIVGNKTVIVQIKSKKLTELSKKGDEEKLRKDFKEAVQDAYDQGLKSRKAVIEKGNIFIKNDGEELKLDEQIDDAYIICLTSDNYPAIAHQTSVYLKKGEGDPYPIAINIADLDIITFYLNDPYDLIYYLRQRSVLSPYFKTDSEIALLGVHLNQKLWKDPEYDFIGVPYEMAQLIDANFPAMRGYAPKTPAMERLRNKWKNEKFQALIDQIKATKEPGLTDALFFLFDLSGETADKLIRLIDQTKEKARQNGALHDFSLVFEEGKSGVSYISLPAKLAEKFQSQLFGITIAKKYKTKADIWIGLGSIAESTNVIDGIVFGNEPWKHDSELEKVSKVALKFGERPKRDGKKIGRNDPCFCGSGKKLKKCCGG